MTPILLFAFRRTIAETIAKHLNFQADKVYLDSTETAVEKFVEGTDLKRYDYLLGLGMYSGRDHDALRIETQCSNQFRNGNRDGLRRLAIPHFLRPGPHIKLADGMGTSWCNLVSYKIMSKSPDAAYTFLHVPKTFDAMLAVSVIESQMTNSPSPAIVHGGRIAPE